MSDEEKETERLRRLVLDICDGRVFTSEGLTADEIRMSFMIVAMMEKKDFPEDFSLIWEHMSKASTWAINGMPMFLSCHFETRATHERLHKAIVAELERREAVPV